MRTPDSSTDPGDPALTLTQNRAAERATIASLYTRLGYTAHSRDSIIDSGMRGTVGTAGTEGSTSVGTQKIRTKVRTLIRQQSRWRINLLQQQRDEV